MIRILIFISFLFLSMLDGQSTQKLLLKSIDGSHAKLHAYSYRDGVWQHERTFDAIIGRNGVGKSREGDGKTPVGSFTLSHLYTMSPIDTTMPHTLTTATMHCVDDATSRYYNRIVDTRTITRDYTSFEEMARADGLYDIVVTIDYNPTHEAGKGSCIFLHIKRADDAPTAGCVAVDKEGIEWIAKWLEEDAHPRIEIKP